MKIKEIRGLGTQELQNKNNELLEELFRLKIRHASGQLDSTATLGKMRKEIARVATVLKEKEAAN
jgi:large subunit ribosomal protein L29